MINRLLQASAKSSLFKGDLDFHLIRLIGANLHLDLVGAAGAFHGQNPAGKRRARQQSPKL